MANRRDFHFRQKVTEAELDDAFEQAEVADRLLAADVGIYGILSGAVPTQHDPVPDLTIDLTGPAKAYDRAGQRVFAAVGQRVDCSVDSSGISTEVTLAPNERWIGVFIRFARALSDPRTDGNSQLVYFRRDESFEIVVRQGPEAEVGLAPKVALQEAELLVYDVKRGFGQNELLDEHIDLSRRQAFIFARAEHVEVDASTWNTLAPASETVQSSFDAVDEILTDLAASDDDEKGAALIGNDAVAGVPNALIAGTARDHIAGVLGHINDHENATTGAHAASAISAAAHEWIATTTVQAQIAEVVAGLLALAGDYPGAARVGNTALDVEGGLTSYKHVDAGTVKAQLLAILTSLNQFIAHLTVGTSGSSYITNAEVEGTPYAIEEGSVGSALEDLLEGLNGLHGGLAAQTAPPGASLVGNVQATYTQSGKTTTLNAGTLSAQLQTLVQRLAEHRGQSGALCDHDGLYSRKDFTLAIGVSASSQYLTLYTVPYASGPPVVSAYYTDVDGNYVLFGTGDRRYDPSILWQKDAELTTWTLTIVNDNVSDSADVFVIVHKVVG